MTDALGNLLGGVAVSAGSSQATSANDGTFTINAGPSSDLVIGLTKSGYLPTSKAVAAVTGSSPYVAVAMVAMAAPITVDVTDGGLVTGVRGAAVAFGPGALVDSSGNTVTGEVQFSLTPLSPANPGELAAYPGNLVGSVDGGLTFIQTYGVLDITATQNGNPVQVAPGQMVTATIPIAATSSPASTQDLWSFNLQTALWDHEGQAQLAAGNTSYTAQLQHFSFHNIDGYIHTGQASCLTGIVIYPDGGPVAGAFVSPEESDTACALIQTDSSGRYCTWVYGSASDTLTADSTYPPFGEGSITYQPTPGSAPVGYALTCSVQNCQNAPPIVISQSPCATNADCAAGVECCDVGGVGLCLEDLACHVAGGGPAPDGGIPGGNTCDADGGPDAVSGTIANGNTDNPAQPFTALYGVGAYYQGPLPDAGLGYALEIYLFDNCISKAEACSTIFNADDYSNLNAVVFGYTTSSPITVGTYILTDAGWTSANGGGPAFGQPWAYSENTDVNCTNSGAVPAESGTVDLATLSSTSVSGTMSLNWYLGLGSVSGSFNVSMCTTADVIDAGPGGKTDCVGL